MHSEERIASLIEFIKADPSDVSAKYMLALEYIKNDIVEKALDLMDEIFINHPDYLANYYHFGKLLEKENDFVKALMIYRQGISVARDQKNLHAMAELNAACDGLDE